MQNQNPLPSAKYTTNFWPLALNSQIDDYLLAHESVPNNFNTLIGYKTFSNIYLRKMQLDTGEESNEYAFARELSHYVVGARPAQLQVREAGANLEALLRFSLDFVSYSQQAVIPDSIEVRNSIQATGLYNDIDNRNLWHEDDFWYVAEQENYRHHSVVYLGEPYTWEKDLVLTEQIRRDSLRSIRGQALAGGAIDDSGYIITRQEHTDFRSYRPLDVNNPELLPEALVSALSAEQVTVEAVAAGMVATMLKGEHFNQSVQSRAYTTNGFPYTHAQVEADPNQSISTVVGQLVVSPDRYIKLTGY